MLLPNALSSGAFLLLYTEDKLSDIPAHLRRRALLGFVKAKNVDMNSDYTKSYLEYAKKNAGKLIDLAYKYPELLTFLLENQLIKAADIDAYLSQVFGVEQPEAHRAYCDAEANVGVYFKLKELD